MSNKDKSLDALNQKVVKDVIKETQTSEGHLDDSQYEVLSVKEISKPSPIFSIWEKKIKTPAGIITRQIVYHADSVVAGIYRPAGGNSLEVLVTEEYRSGTGRVTKALVAGLVNDGEVPEDSLEREVWEESGINIKAVYAKKVATIVSSEGFTNEHVHIFSVPVTHDVKLGKQSLDSDEYLKVHWEPLKKLLDLVKRGEIVSAPTIIFLQDLQNGLLSVGSKVY